MLGDRCEIYDKLTGLGVRFMGFIKFLNFSPMEKTHGPGPWLCGPVVWLESMVDQRVGTDWKEPGRGGALTGLGPPATLGHGSSPTGAEKREGSRGVLLRASPELRWQCSDRATAMKRWRWCSSSEGGEKEERKVR
jgi:hypothetical protein